MIGLIAAMRCEAEALSARLAQRKSVNISGMDFESGLLEGKEVVLAVSGEGKVNAALCAQTMVLAFHPSLLVNTGVAGSLSPTLRVPDVAVATSAGEHDSDLSPLGYGKGEVLIHDLPHCLFPVEKGLWEKMLAACREAGVHAEAGAILSGDQFIASEEKKAELRGRYPDAVACEMEGGAVGHAAFVNGIPFAVIRAISDNANDGRAFDPVRAAEISVAVTLRFLRKM